MALHDDIFYRLNFLEMLTACMVSFCIKRIIAEHSTRLQL
jgi:hypothetical protein